LLDAAEIPAPYVFIGHSFGGLVARAYAAQYPNQVVGLVLVDPLGASDWLQPSEAQSRILQRGVKLSRRGALLARLGIVRLSLVLLSGGSRRLPQLIAKLSSGRGESTISRIAGEVRKMPPETWPMIRSHWSQPKSFLGMSAYLESLPLSCAEAAALSNPSHIPITILSAADSPDQQIAEREAMARTSPHGKHVIATKSGHWIHLDEPDLVIQVIREMVELVRARSV
jgi:pimeloyl-ACP methyl ester carboxylesterase